MKQKLFILLVISLTHISAQNFQEFSVHKAQREEYKTEDNILSKFNNDGSGIIPLQVNSKKELSKIVFGYMPDWEYNNGAHANQHYDLLTHIAAFDFPVSESGSVGKPSGWPWNDVINAAHTAGTKVIMTAVSFDKDDIRNIITNSTAKQKFFSETKSIISTYKLDGVNVDFEGLYSADRGSRINSFMSELTAYIHSELPGKEVSFAGPAVNWGNYWDLDGLVQSCDYVFIMGYSFWGSWSSTSGPCAPLTGFTNDITSVVTEDYGVPVSKYPEKIILGVPYYGLKWKTVSSNAYAKVDTANGGYQGSTRFYKDVDNADIYGLLWDDVSQTSWYRWQEGAQWYQNWFDDVRSLNKKYDLAITENLGGIGMWALGYDGEKQDLWNLIDLKFGSATLPVPNKPKSFQVIQYNKNTLLLGYELTDYADKYGIYLSTNGKDFSKITESTSNSVSITNLQEDSVYYFKVNAINASGVSNFTEVLAGIPSEIETSILIVNGFDRTDGTTNTFDFIKQYDFPMKNLHYNFSSASNEAVYKGFVKLSDFKIVIWMLLDESSVDETFNSLEQSVVKSYLDNNGTLIVSGSEVGWDLSAKGSSADKEFYSNYLRAKYLTDAPNNTKGVYYTVLDNSGNEYTFDNGTHGTIDVDWPDAIEAINASENIFSYKGVATSNGYAGIEYAPFGSAGGLVYLAFPIESVYNNSQRTALLGDILENYIVKPSVSSNNALPGGFKLEQNYPNPFNPSTTISYTVPSVDSRSSAAMNVVLKVYDLLGREVATLVNEQQQQGNYSVLFNSHNSVTGKELTSGTYFYRITIGEYSDSKKMILLK